MEVTTEQELQGFVRGQAHSKGMESFRYVFTRGLHGTRHRLSVQHAGRFVSEFARRRDARSCDTEEQMRRMVGGLFGKSLTYRHLTGKAAVAA